jgi:hypothetical protein
MPIPPLILSGEANEVADGMAVAKRRGSFAIPSFAVVKRRYGGPSDLTQRLAD